MTHATPSHATPFTSEQVDWFQSEDRHAAKVIIGLMTGIFTTGLFIYAIVAWYVYAG
ncbi:MAG TPA: hypothetical protein VGZ25_07770 [Gemmataceae bacterium]|jgi:hypothetical protein|nr:hypothetical protein [Gemmataceae bacterium]